MLVGDVIKATARACDMTVDQVLMQDRTKRTTRVRQVGILITSRVSTASWPMIGQRWGGRDHTTALHSASRAQERLLAGCEEVADVLAAVLAEIGLEELPSERPSGAELRRIDRSALEMEIRTLEIRLAQKRAALQALTGAQT